MANPEHLEILKQGVEAWNRWRKENTKIRPNLIGAALANADLYEVAFQSANLSKAVLNRAELGDADLSRANLSEANLTGASLISADLTGADLSYANLREANLSHVNFNHANLTDANLSSSFLINANLSNAILGGANLSLAGINYTTIGNTDLSAVIGLDSVRFWGPASIGIDTIYKSKGNIPEQFLRGCGVPDEFIEFSRSLLGSAREFFSCFISYSSKNQDFAERLYANLQNKGVRCWFAPEEMKIGDKLRPRIDETIRIHDKLLLVLSEHSVTSQWVEQEVETALDKEREQGRTVLFPIRLDDTVLEVKAGWPALIKNTRHIGDFSKWKEHDSYSRAFERLLRDLKDEGKA